LISTHSTMSAAEPTQPPTMRQFSDALTEYRIRWPHDGYPTTRERFLETYRVMRRHWRGGTTLDVGGWPGDFSCVLASLRFDIALVDKQISRPIHKQFDRDTNQWTLGGSISL